VYINKGLLKVYAWNPANLPIKKDPQQQQHKNHGTKTESNTGTNTHENKTRFKQR
jgi:hypothetical protein